MSLASTANPNLFILGAPKCGTTALAEWLAVHPSVFVPPVKEPHYHSSEYRLTERAAYEALYRDIPADACYAVDASVWQLYSPNAVPSILAEVPDARFIAMVRNPLDMIPSMHRQQVFNGNELEADLRSALALHQQRLAGAQAKVLSGYPPDHLAYYRSCALGWQVEKLFERVPRDRVHVVVLDDLRDDPETVVRGVYAFLGLEPVMPPEFATVNAAKVRRLPGLDRAAKALGEWKHRRGIRFRFGVLAWLRRVNRKREKLAPLERAMRIEISTRLADDTALLSRALGRDLSHWVHPR